MNNRKGFTKDIQKWVTSKVKKLCGLSTGVSAQQNQVQIEIEIVIQMEIQIQIEIKIE